MTQMAAQNDVQTHRTAARRRGAQPRAGGRSAADCRAHIPVICVICG
jgi:hypothetical protein